MNIDLEADAKQEVPATDLTKIRELAEEMRGILSRLDSYKKVAEQLADRYQRIELELLPEAMMTVGMQEFKLVTGEIIKIKPIVRGSIPSATSIEGAQGTDKTELIDRKDRCFQWLKAHNGESLIKTKVVAEFGKGERTKAEEIRSQIVAAGYKATADESVHAQTLNKFLREQLEAGVDVPSEPFALFSGNKAEIVKPKKK